MVKSVVEMLAELEQEQSPAHLPAPQEALRHTAASNAKSVQSLLRRGGELSQGWRFGILQSVDDYEAALKRGGVTRGVQFWHERPSTGSEHLDAAFASLAEHFAHRDQWTPPEWAATVAALSEPWFPEVMKMERALARIQTPAEFKRRNIFITDTSLSRA